LRGFLNYSIYTLANEVRSAHPTDFKSGAQRLILQSAEADIACVVAVSTADSDLNSSVRGGGHCLCSRGFNRRLLSCLPTLICRVRYLK